MRRRHLLLLSLLPLALACDRWRPNEPKTLHFYDALGAYDIALGTLHQLEYDKVTADPARYHIEAEAKIDGGGSFMAIQIYSDARMVIRVYGKLAKGDKIHRKLAEEVEQLAAALRASGQVVR